MRGLRVVTACCASGAVPNLVGLPLVDTPGYGNAGAPWIKTPHIPRFSMVSTGENRYLEEDFSGFIEITLI